MTKTTIGVTLSLLAALGGCGEPQAASPRPAPVERAAPAPQLPDLALGFDAANAPEIAAAQAQLKAEPDHPQSYVALATAFLRAARSEGGANRAYARDVIEVGLARTTDAPRLRLLAAMLLLDDHRFEQVIAAANELAVDLPYDPTPRLLVGDASLELGRYEAAEKAYEAAIDLRPDLRSYNRIGYMRWLYGDFDGAVEALEYALDAGSARDPESMAWCFTDLGAMYLRRGEAVPAKKAAARALELVPDYAPALVLAGRAAAEVGDLAGGRELLARAAERSASAETILRIVELDRAMEDTAQARSGLHDALAMAEHDPRPVAHFLARRGEQPMYALQLAEQELEARQNIWSWDTLALASVRAGDTKRARDAIDKARSLGTQDAELTLHAALVEMSEGDTNSARAHLEEAVAARPNVDPVLVAEIRGQLGAS
ncbi:MAG: hypothetical protein ACE37F_09945 [Nannocystaceae bacterium]|nr:tetratricopeptide repeat protein [bacterium]